MRIGFVVYGGLHQQSGGFLYDRMLVERLRQRGHEVVEVALPWRRFAPALAAGAFGLARGERAGFDVVIEDELVFASRVLEPWRWARRAPSRVALVHNLTCVQPRVRARRARKIVERAYLHGVDAVVCVCESTAADVRRVARDVSVLTVARAGRDHVSSHATLAQARSRALAPGPLRVAFVGVVAPHKGVHRAVEALGRCSPQHAVELDVYGSSSDHARYRRQLDARISALGLAARVRFHGFVEQHELMEALGRAHVLVLPSDREAYPLTCIEALSAGLGVLATDRGGAREIVRDGLDGHVLAPDDIAAWAARLSEWSLDRSRLADVAARSIERYAQLGTWDDTTDAVLEVLQRLLARGQET